MTWKISLAAVLLLAVSAVARAWWHFYETTPPQGATTNRTDDHEVEQPERSLPDERPEPAVALPDTNVAENEPLPAVPETAGPPVADGKWGHLSGTFLLDGDVPEVKKFDIKVAGAFCGRHPLINESLVVDPKTGGVQNVILYLYLQRGEKPPQPHPDYQASAEGKVVLDNRHCRFEPHVTLLRTTQTLLVQNSDMVGHNTRVNVLSNRPISPIVPPSAEFEARFETVERLPVQVACNIHPWMRGWIVIRESPYMAVSDAQGKFRIENLPVGDWTFQVWQEEMGYVKDVKIGGKSVPWKRGRLEVKIQPGENDLGEISLPLDE